MVLPIVDEIQTPRCPNCAIKHLTAAVAILGVHRIMNREVEVPAHEAMAARALINISEADEGYMSHFDFAIGILAYAEILATSCGQNGNAIMYREVRTGLMSCPDSVEARETLVDAISPDALFIGHVIEATREMGAGGLPIEFSVIDNAVVSIDVAGQETVDDLLRIVRYIREEYFSVPDPGEEHKEGEEPMTKKAKANAAAKKAPAVPVDAMAAQGGKCKGSKSCKK